MKRAFKRRCKIKRIQKKPQNEVYDIEAAK